MATKKYTITFDCNNGDMLTISNEGRNASISIYKNGDMRDQPYTISISVSYDTFVEIANEMSEFKKHII